MHTYELISKDWIVSPTARRVYHAAAAASLTVYFSLPSILWNGPTSFLKLALFFGVVGAALTGLAMEYFLFRFDQSQAWKQIFWFCVMLIPPLGPALYCFLVYSRSPAFGSTSDADKSVIDSSKPLA